MGKVNLRQTYLIGTLPFFGWIIGWKLDKMEDERMSRFRDKSALYKRDVPPAVPSWS